MFSCIPITKKSLKKLKAQQVFFKATEFKHIYISEQIHTILKYIPAYLYIF